jgi:glucokinase
VRQFVSHHKEPVDRACFGIAGPVKNGQVKTPNLAWVVEAKRLAGELSLPTVGLINDLEANAYGINELAPEDFVILNRGAPDAQGNAAVISAGTGLGEAGMYWDGTRHRPFAGEGGHADFAPHDQLEADLLLYLKKQFGHVSWERVVSGPGLYNIYQFLRNTGRCQESPDLREAMRERDPSAVISQAALENRCPLSGQAMELFVALYGAEAGNLALKIMATGGVFLGGGIAPKILPKLQGAGFMKAFAEKGRFRSLLEAIPVRVILNDETALLGAAHYAARVAA